MLRAINPAPSIRVFLHLLPASGQRGDLRFGVAHRQTLGVDELDSNHAEEAKHVL
jgi:hypothetical protein